MKVKNKLTGNDAEVVMDWADGVEILENGEVTMYTIEVFDKTFSVC